MAWYRVRGVLVRGHGVASGTAGDARYPEGTLALQRPRFRERGLDLDRYFHGTLNVSIAPYRYEVREPRHTFRQVAWTDFIPPEDFSFFDCRAVGPDGTAHEGLVYYPHPETKPEHFQDPHVLEVLTSRIDGLRYGDALFLELDDRQIALIEPDAITRS